MNRSAFRFPNPSTPLRYDGERYVSGLPGEIQSEHYHRYLLALVYCAGKDVLDVASGEGYGCACLGQVARSVVGVDANAEAVDFANSNYLNERISFKQGRAQNLPIESQSVDVVVSFETLEHLAEHDLFAQEIRRVLRPGGLLIMSSPNRTVYTEEANYHNEFHVRELDRDEFLVFLNSHFPNVKLLSQRTLVGSVIANESDESLGRPEGFIWRGNGVFERTMGTPHPPFFLALASDAMLPEIRSSMLHNPAPLYHIEELRQRAVKELAERTAQVDELETALAAQSRQVGQLEAILAQRGEQVGQLETILAQRGEQVGELEKLIAERNGKVGDLEKLIAQKSETMTRRAADVRRGGAKARITALRAELEGARRRSEEMRSELRKLSAEHAATANLRAEADQLAHRFEQLAEEKERLSAMLASVLRSTSWRLTAPVRRISERLRGATRHEPIAPANGNDSAPAQSILPHPETTLEPAKPAVSAEPDEEILPPPQDTAAVRPSERFLAENPAWIEPQKRPDFIELSSVTPSARIAVVLHLYYTELWQEIAAALANIVEPFDLFVTLVAGASDHVAPDVRTVFPDANILIVDNHGRDILPFLEVLHSGVLFKYELICKLHTKRTPWRAGGEEWRQHLIGGVLGSPEIVHRILSAFDSDSDLGMVVADRQLFQGRAYWASNEARLIGLFPKIGLTPEGFEKSFAGGSIFWIRPLLLRSIDALGLGFDDFEPEPIGNDGATAHAVERLISLVCHDAGMRIEETGNLGSRRRKLADDQPKVHLIANYLPQYHPIPENDAWWGTGFTEWTNVTAAKPQFENHRQPRLPADLGFYDLRMPEVRQAQADLARQYGITAFSYYYYWFNGRRLLERPLNEVLASGEPDFPFMICWANEPWTRNWDGLSQEVLMPQDYEPGWEQRFAADVAPLLRDPRYLQLNDLPVLAIYRVMDIPNPAEAMLRLRASFRAEGVPHVHLIGGWLEFDGNVVPPSAQMLNLDAYFEFPPHGIPVQKMSIDRSKQAPGCAAHVYDYNATVEATIDQLALGSEEFRYHGVMIGWDNTPRRGRNANLFHGATPTSFRRWLRATVERARIEAPGPETAVFINAWNEWGEGTYLEPDQDFGHGWLEAVASVAAVENHPFLTQAGPQESAIAARAGR